MTKRAYSYPADEFDVADGTDVPSGAHRQSRSGWKFTGQIVLALVLGAALAVAVVTAVDHWQPGTSKEIGSSLGVSDSPTPSGDTDTPKAGASGQDDDQDAHQEDGDDDSDTVGPESGDGSPSDGSEADGSEEGNDADHSPSSDDTAADDEADSRDVDHSTAVRVLNATSIRGLAGRGAQRLGDAGWSSVTSGNYTGAAVSSSIVYYRSSDDEAAAEAAADDLGVSRVQQLGSLSGPVIVVLDADLTQ